MKKAVKAKASVKKKVARAKELTPKQQMFCKEYLVDLNATQAAMRAGYSKNTAEVIGYQQLQKSLVKQEIQRLMDKRAEKVEITAEYVLNTIQDTVERCKQARPVLDREGKPVMVETPDGGLAPAYTFEANAVLKGCELLGKHLVLFTDKQEHSGPNGGPVPMSIEVKFVDPVPAKA